jgi:preprotein translocase subunit SecE
VAKQNDQTRITRITANEPSSTSQSKKKKAVAVAATSERSAKRPVRGFFGYFKGAWQELRQVHWPTRRATWGLTAAVLLFSAFFVVFITVLDAIFKYVFEQVLGS